VKLAATTVKIRLSQTRSNFCHAGFMREMSASEASRNFSAVLDSAERGETTVVTRGGRRIALIAPVPRANARALLDVFSKWRDNAAFDDAFAEQVGNAREAVSNELDSDPWHD